MHGKIFFDTTESFTKWLILWAGQSTAVFVATEFEGGWKVEFKGGI